MARSLVAEARRVVLVVGSACCIAGCEATPADYAKTPPSLVLRPDFDEFRRLRGQWRGTEVGGTTEWTFSFDDSYMVVVSSASGEWYQGLAGLHFELGRATDGAIWVPPGSSVVDVDVFGSDPPEHDGRTSLGAFYLTSPAELKLCASRPGLHVRARSYDISSPALRCFRLHKISDQPVASQPLPIEREDAARE